MARLYLNIIVVIFLKLYYVWGNDPNFTKIVKISKRVHPFKLNDDIQFLAYDYEKRHYIRSSLEYHNQTCRFPKVHWDYLVPLGNERILAILDNVTSQINVVDLTNCSSPAVTFISDGQNNTNLDEGYLSKSRFGTVVTYNDTFDVFDWYQESCTPCRYNDKGERLRVEHSLEKEPTGRAGNETWQHSGYFLQLVKDAFGVKNGYFYLFRYTNETTALRILDSNFKIVKHRLFDAGVENYSVLQENITVCYNQDACRQMIKTSDQAIQSEQRICQYVQCHLLDSDLKTIAEVKLHQVDQISPDKDIIAMSMVENLVGGGAMVAMSFRHQKCSDAAHRQDIFIQRIHPNGRVDPPIQFESLDTSYLFMDHFVLDNGEYCLFVGHAYHWSSDTETIVRCWNPSTADYKKI